MPGQVFDYYEEFRKFSMARAEALAMEVGECELGALYPDWRIGSDAVARPDGAFFRLTGLKVRKAAGREVVRWVQPMIHELGGAGTVALVVVQETGIVLVRMKAEPGNIGIMLGSGNTCVLVSPPLQFSASNLAKHHGGTPVPLADICEGQRFSVSWVRASEDGARFLHKENRIGLVLVPNRTALDADLAALGDGQADFAWVTPDVLRQILRSGYANSHLRSVMALLV